MGVKGSKFDISDFLAYVMKSSHLCGHFEARTTKIGQRNPKLEELKVLTSGLGSRYLLFYQGYSVWVLAICYFTREIIHFFTFAKWQNSLLLAIHMTSLIILR